MEIIKIKDSGKKFDLKRKVLVIDDNENKTVPKLKFMKKSDAYKNMKKSYKSYGYWNEETIIEELKPICEELGHFPTQNELRKMNRNDLIATIGRNGGGNHFKEKMGYDYKIIYHKSYKKRGYWSEKTIIEELKILIEEIGHFPIQIELQKIYRNDLMGAINKYGGYNHFREKMGYDLLQKPNRYWNEENIIEELKIMIEKLGHFPSVEELRKDMGDLSDTIYRHGGINYFREKCGVLLSIHEKYRSELMSYVNIRGNKSEQIVKDIINDWSINNNKSCPDFNVKLAPRNVIEFVCDFNKRIGIDVTNTKASKGSAYTTIRNKWKKKDYCLYLDELWIVVFTDVLTSDNYIELNEISPDNIKVFSIEDFILELDYYTEDQIQDKIDQLKECSFHTKEELINMNRSVIGWL